MKKSFLKTFIVLGLFSIFLCGGFENVGAQVFDLYTNKDMKTKIDTARIAPINSASEKNNDRIIQEQTNANAGECSWTDVVCGIRVGFAELLIALSVGVTKLVSIAGYIFDEAIKVTTTYPAWGASIYGAWKIIRDFTNIILVFSLLYLGIKTIYEGQGFADKKTLAGIIIAAILINFSFFFVKDVAFNLSNTLGLQVLQNVRSAANDSYSAGLMDLISPQTLMSNVLTSARSGWATLFASAGQLILFSAITLSLGLIFVGVALMLIYRFIIFIILMISSPLGFVSTQIPWLKQYGTQWSTQLKQQVVFFPAFTLTLYIVLYICIGIAGTITPTIVAGAANSTTNPIFDFIFKFILIMGFMIGLMILPAKMGVAGAGLMDRAGKNVTQRIRNIPRRTAQLGGQAAASGTARAARYVGGGLIGSKLLQGNTMKKMSTSNNGIARFVGQTAVKSGEGLRNQTFDVRNTKAGAKLGIGKGIEGWGKAVDKEKTEYLKTKEKEKKLFGYDKMHESDQNKLDIAKLEVKRKNAEATYKSAEIAYKANPNTATLGDLNVDQKALEEREKAVGEKKNLGDIEYDKHYSKRWLVALSPRQTPRAGVRKAREETQKKWKSSGQSSAKIKARAEKARDEAALSTPPASPPSPTPPTP